MLEEILLTDLKILAILAKQGIFANHAIVFMIRGLLLNRNNQLDISLVRTNKGQTFAIITRSCISKVTETGLNVVALVCDQWSNNRSFIQHLEKVTIDRPYLMYENRRIFVFYDPPHLLKNVRNNLKKADLRIDEGVVSWQCIVDFYNFDKCQPNSNGTKVEDRHIELPPFSAM